MSARELPARPHLDHLKHEAKALLNAWASDDPVALQRVRHAIADTAERKLSLAQRVIAREYGFHTWAQLRSHVQASRSNDNGIDDFLSAVHAQNVERAREVLSVHPHIATTSLHVAATLGLDAVAAQLIAENPGRVSERAGDPPAAPLLFLCYSPFHGESDDRDAGLLATARVLLAAGADPNTRDAQYNVPVLYAVTGMRSVLPIAQVLLDAGANPTDGESIFHAAERFHEDALKLLLTAGADLNYVGDWGNTALYFLLLNWDLERETRVKQGLGWLLDHGADPNVVSTEARETALHIAVRRGQRRDVIQLLLDHGADVHARRRDGATPWLLARRGGFDELASLLESLGAETRRLSTVDLLLAACGRGDVDGARQLASPDVLAALDPSDYQLLVEAATLGRERTVAACIAAGFPVNTTDAAGATALHYSALHGRARQVRMLLDAGAATDIRDKEHSSTPLGWACFGADVIGAADGDYEDCVRALLEAGARLQSNERQPEHEGVRSVIERFSSPR
jgi:ankyrin repeat protein